MVDRRLRNCPLCGQQNAMFMYRTDVGSGQTIATCSSCNGEIRVNPPDSPPLSPFSSPGFTKRRFSTTFRFYTTFRFSSSF